LTRAQTCERVQGVCGGPSARSGRSGGGVADCRFTAKNVACPQRPQRAQHPYKQVCAQGVTRGVTRGAAFHSRIPFIAARGGRGGRGIGQKTPNCCAPCCALLGAAVQVMQSGLHARPCCTRMGAGRRCQLLGAAAKVGSGKVVVYESCRQAPADPQPTTNTETRTQKRCRTSSSFRKNEHRNAAARVLRSAKRPPTNPPRAPGAKVYLPFFMWFSHVLPPVLRRASSAASSDFIYA
jgi:hypothetical protein